MDRDPIPPETPRSNVLGRLRRERWFAADAGETARVAEIDRQIQELSAANTPTAPARETAASTAPRATAARGKNHPRGNSRVAAR